MIVGAALGFAAAGTTGVVGTQRGAHSAYLAATLVPTDDCHPFFDHLWGCWDSWWEFPPEKSPYDSPPTAVLQARQRYV